MRTLILLLSALSVVRALTDAELAMFKPRLGSNYLEANTNSNPVVIANDNGDGSQTIFSNGVPSHETWVFPHIESENPNPVKARETNLTINKDPVMRDTPMRCLPMESIGIATSGVAIWGWYPAEDGCPDVVDFEQLDICAGHPGPPPAGNQYHYHYYSPCVQVQTCGEPSPIYGVALDGIPIYGPIDENGVELTRKDLDECGGRIDNTGRYKYHITADPYYTISCFKGEIRSDSGKDMNTFRCTCPYSDAPFKTRPPQFELSPVICTAGEGAEPIQCDDSNVTAMAAAFEYEWNYVETDVDMTPCCPSGTDCGTSCVDSDNKLKSVCLREKKKIDKLTRMKKGTGDSGAMDRGQGTAAVVVVAIVFAVFL